MLIKTSLCDVSLLLAWAANLAEGVACDWLHPVKPATCINKQCLQCSLGGLKSNGCEQLNRREMLDANECASASVLQREKKQEKLK